MLLPIHSSYVVATATTPWSAAMNTKTWRGI